MQKDLWRKGLVIGIMVLFVGASVVPSVLSEEAQKKSDFVIMQTTWYVDDDNCPGPGNGTIDNPFCKIQYGIDNASDGDTIYVFNGTYYENIVIDKSIILLGENKDTTIVDGNGKGDVALLTADNTCISNLTLQNGGTGQELENLNDASLEIIADDTVVENMICLSTNYGMWLRSSNNNIIRNNYCNAIFDGIWLLNSKNDTLKNNSIDSSGLVLDGSELSDFIHDIDTSNKANGKTIIYLKNQQNKTVSCNAGQVILVNCSKCILSNMVISNVTDCIEIMYSCNNIITNNILSHSTDHGIRMFRSNHNIITNNTCSHNPGGISFVGFTGNGETWADYEIRGDCKYNIITNNKIVQNYLGIRLYSSNKNYISKNIFINNTFHSYFWDCNNKWNANYWNEPRFLPKIIFGKITIGNFENFPWINIDWRPALKPYDI